MRKFDFDLADGYPLRQGTPKEMMNEMDDRLTAFIGWFSDSTTETSFILSGMNLAPGNNITSGYCYIDGSLLYFNNQAGNANSKIGKVFTSTEMEYQDGILRMPWKHEVAQAFAPLDVPEGVVAITYSDLTRIPRLWDKPQALIDKVNGIENGAEVNVQADWEQTNPDSDSYVKNKPIFYQPLVIGSVNFGWMNLVNNGQYLPVTGQLVSCEVKSYKYQPFQPDGRPELDWFKCKIDFESLPDANYDVQLYMNNNPADPLWELSNGCFFSVGEKTSSSFMLSITHFILSKLNLEIKILKNG